MEVLHLVCAIMEHFLEISAPSRFWKVNSEEYVIKPESMKANENNRILLTPRFVQPCRINFRWLANDQDNLENFQPYVKAVYRNCNDVMA